MQAETWDWPLQHADGVVNLINKRDSFSCDLEMPFFTARDIDVSNYSMPLLNNMNEARLL